MLFTEIWWSWNDHEHADEVVWAKGWVPGGQMTRAQEEKGPLRMRPSALVNGDGAAYTAPYFGPVSPRGNASDVNGRAALALYGGVHGPSEEEGLHQVNASSPCDLALKDDETSRRGEPFDLPNGGSRRCASRLNDEVLHLFEALIKGCSVHDGPSAQQRHVLLSEKRKEVWEVGKTVVGKVDQQDIRFSS
jgi:hypothetical protein